MRGGETTGSQRVMRAEGMINTGDTNTGVRAPIRERGGKAAATAAAGIIPHPTTTSLVTGAQVGTMNAIRKLKQ